VLSRQGLPVLDPDTAADGVSRGAYVVHEAEAAQPDLVLIATGSEVGLALLSAEELENRDIRTRVVSMPSWEFFREQPAEYREALLPALTPKLAIEAAHPMGWHEFVGSGGDVVALDRFGASGPGAEVYAELGFTVEHVVARAVTLTSARSHI